MLLYISSFNSPSHLLPLQSLAMEQAGTQARPVPAPRRLYPELRAANYENIEINLPSSSSSSSNKNNTNNNNNNNIQNKLNNSNSGSKKLNNDAENLHGNCAEKKLPASGHSKLILQEANVEQPIYGPDANENVEPVYALPRPAPRQRARAELLEQQQDEQVQEEEEEEKKKELIMASPKALRTAPSVPSKELNVQMERRRPDRCSISSEFSTTSFGTGNGQLEDDSRYTSNASLDCSESGSQSGKFKSPSPGYVRDDDDHDEHDHDLDHDDDDDGDHHVQLRGQQVRVEGAEYADAAISDLSELSASCDDDK